jgi:hypothetical protein
MFSNIDEHVRRLLRRPAGQELHPDRSQERAMLVPRDGRHLGPGKASALTCGDWNGATRLENRALRVPLPGASKGVRGPISAEPPRADKAAELFHPCSARAWWPNGPKPAACRQARGRRRPDDREVVRRRPVPQGGNTALGTSSKSNAGGFSHGAGPRVSGDDAPQQRVLVTRNVGCRSGFEAS